MLEIGRIVCPFSDRFDGMRRLKTSLSDDDLPWRRRAACCVSKAMGGLLFFVAEDGDGLRNAEASSNGDGDCILVDMADESNVKKWL